jgi:hypothetical protein
VAKRIVFLNAVCCGLLFMAAAAKGDESFPVSTDLSGTVGLNTVPSARMDPDGTVRVQAARLAPYSIATFGVQVASPLYISLRQTAQASSLFAHPDALYPGIDGKLRLVQESRFRPAIAIGWQGIGGVQGLADQYVVLSKRWYDLDFSGGLNWSALGSRNGVPNPFDAIPHFRQRNGDPFKADEPTDWFTGRPGAFGGVGLNTPVPGLTLKADWSADSYKWEAETDPGYKPPAPWSLGFSYAPRSWVTFGAAFVGSNTIYGSLSFQAPAQDWPGRPGRDIPNLPLFPPFRAGEDKPAAADVAGAAHGLYLSSVADGLHRLITRFQLQPGTFLPDQLNAVLRLMAIPSGRANDALTVQPVALGLSGPSITFDRWDLEQALGNNNGSPQEIWQHVAFGPSIPDSAFPNNQAFLDQPVFYNLVFDNKLSLSEDDHALLYRTSVIGEYQKMLTAHLMSGQSLRLNLADNLQNLNEYRTVSYLPVRSDEDVFAERRIAVDRSYISYMRSLNRDWHYAVTAGYLEEMYGGAGGEILYRPFGHTYAFGVEMWEALKRDPYQPLDLGFNGDHLLSGHLKAYYEIPHTDLTLEAKVGRYLAEDLGGTLAIANHFRNGASIEAFVTATATDAREQELYGTGTHLYSGIRLRLPLGNLPLVPSGSEARVTVAPIGRDTGQSIDNPVPLYDITDQFSYRTIADHWTDIQK